MLTMNKQWFRRATATTTTEQWQGNRVNDIWCSINYIFMQIYFYVMWMLPVMTYSRPAAQWKKKRRKQKSRKKTLISKSFLASPGTYTRNNYSEWWDEEKRSILRIAIATAAAATTTTVHFTSVSVWGSLHSPNGQRMVGACIVVCFGISHINTWTTNRAA